MLHPLQLVHAGNTMYSLCRWTIIIIIIQCLASYFQSSGALLLISGQHLQVRPVHNTPAVYMQYCTMQQMG